MAEFRPPCGLGKVKYIMLGMTRHGNSIEIELTTALRVLCLLTGITPKK